MVVGWARVRGVKNATAGEREERVLWTLMRHEGQNMPSTKRVMVRSVESSVVFGAGQERGEDETKEQSNPASSMMVAMSSVGREARCVTVADEVRTETSALDIDG